MAGSSLRTSRICVEKPPGPQLDRQDRPLEHVEVSLPLLAPAPGFPEPGVVEPAPACQRVATGEVVPHLRQVVTEPFAERSSEARLGTRDRRRGHQAAGGISQDRLGGVPAELPIGAVAGRGLRQLEIDQRHSRLEAERHAHLVGVEEVVVGEIDLEVAIEEAVETGEGAPLHVAPACVQRRRAGELGAQGGTQHRGHVGGRGGRRIGEKTFVPRPIDFGQESPGPAQEGAGTVFARARQAAAGGGGQAAGGLWHGVEQARRLHRPVARIAGEELVGPLARKQHRGAALARQPADQIAGDGGRIGDRLVEMIDQTGPELRHLWSDLDLPEPDSEGQSGGSRVRRVVVEAVDHVVLGGIGDGVTVEVAVALTGGQGGDQGAVEPAAEKGPHRHVGDQLARDRCFEELSQLGDGVGARAARRAVSEARVSPQLDGAGGGAPAQDGAGQEPRDPGQGGARVAGVAEGQVLPQDVEVRLAPQPGIGTQGLDLAGEEQDAARRLGVIERLDAEGIANQPQRPLAPIPDGEGEHAVQALDEALAFIEPPEEQDLAVAGGTEDGAPSFERFAQLAEVVDLAVVAQHEPAVGRFHRLGGPVAEVEDREPHMPQGGLGPRVFEHAPAIGAAVRLQRVHSAHQTRLELSYEPGDSAHGLLYSPLARSGPSRTAANRPR